MTNIHRYNSLFLNDFIDAKEIRVAILKPTFKVDLLSHWQLFISIRPKPIILLKNDDL